MKKTIFIILRFDLDLITFVGDSEGNKVLQDRLPHVRHQMSVQRAGHWLLLHRPPTIQLHAVSSQTRG